MNTTVMEAKVWMPTAIKEAWELKEKFRLQSIFIAGGTLLQTQWEKGIVCPPHLISLENIAGLCEIKQNDECFFHIGTLTKLSDCQYHPDLIKKWSLLPTAISQIAAPAVRNLGTIGGNVANGCGDSIPALLAMNAEVSYYNGHVTVREKLESWLDKKQRNEEGILLEIILPEQQHSAEIFSFYTKVGRRESFSGSVLTIAGVIEKTEEGVIYQARLAAGGGDSFPIRLHSSERPLLNKKIDSTVLNQVYDSILAEFQPVADSFFSEEYHRIVAANLIVERLSQMEVCE